MRMPILFAAAVAIAAPMPAMATDWYRVTRTSASNGYIDADAIRQDGQWTVAKIVSINDAVGENGDKSAEAEMQFDCKANTVRVARFEMFTPDRKSLGVLEWPDDGKLHPIEKNTPFADLAAFVCSPSRKGGVRVSDPFADKG